MGVGLRSKTKVLDLSPNPKVNAPVLDPTCEGLEVKFFWSTHLILSAMSLFVNKSNGTEQLQIVSVLPIIFYFEKVISV